MRAGTAAGERGISPANLRYLEAAYYLRGEGESIRRARLASWFGISAPAVTEAVSRLVRDGLLSEHSDQHLELTTHGEQVAAEVVRRHRIVEAWAVKGLGLDWVSADDEAQRLAPVVSDLVLDKMHETVGRPNRCPHGNLIPGEPAEIHPGRRLTELSRGDRSRVQRISEVAEHDAHEVMDAVFTASLVPTTEVLVVEIDDGGGVLVEVKGNQVALSPKVARTVWVSD